MERKKTHLIYLDKDGYVWMQEHNIGNKHPQNAEFYTEVPSNDDKRWIDGIPRVENIQFLTLSPFYPNQRLDVSVEIKRSTQFKNVNHPAFEGCQKYMPVSLLNFNAIPKHIPRSIYTIGLCYYEHKDPYKTVDIPADKKMEALAKGREQLKPSTVEGIRYISCTTNPAYAEHYTNKKQKI